MSIKRRSLVLATVLIDLTTTATKAQVGGWVEGDANRARAAFVVAGLTLCPPLIGLHGIVGPRPAKKKS